MYTDNDRSIRKHDEWEIEVRVRPTPKKYPTQYCPDRLHMTKLEKIRAFTRFVDKWHFVFYSVTIFGIGKYPAVV